MRIGDTYFDKAQYVTAITGNHNPCTTVGNEIALKCKPSAEFDANIEIFGYKTPLHAYVLGEHTSMKN